MKHEIHPERSCCNDKSIMYGEVYSRIRKDLIKTCVYKPIRDLYWESLKNCDYLSDKDYQPYALMKHKCVHRTVEDVCMYRNKLGRKGIINLLKNERKCKCFYCMFSEQHARNEKSRSDYFTLKYILHHLFSKSPYCDSCWAKKAKKDEFNPVEKGDARILKSDLEIEELDTFKHYY